MAFGINRTAEESIAYAKAAGDLGKPIAEHQLRPGEAREDVRPLPERAKLLLFRDLWMTKKGIRMTSGERCPP